MYFDKLEKRNLELLRGACQDESQLVFINSSSTNTKHSKHFKHNISQLKAFIKYEAKISYNLSSFSNQTNLFSYIYELQKTETLLFKKKTQNNSLGPFMLYQKVIQELLLGGKYWLQNQALWPRFRPVDSMYMQNPASQRGKSEELCTI